MNSPPDRRTFLKLMAGGVGALAAGTGGRLFGAAPAILPAQRYVPTVSAVMSGDIGHDNAMIWARADRPSRMLLEWSADAAFRGATTLEGPAALQGTDFTARVDLRELPSNTPLHYRVRFQSLEDPAAFSAPATGRLKTLAHKASATPVRFGWSGDLCGQGYGLPPDGSGLRIFEQLRGERLDFFIFSGDLVYADNPIPEQMTLADGAIWRNRTAPELLKGAETLDEFRARYRYNLTDPALRAFAAEVPLLVQWDDHEVLNNWYPHEMLDGTSPYTVKSVDLLAARGRQAFLEYTPIRQSPTDSERIYRRFRCGEALDVFMLDMRSYRGSNPTNRGDTAGPAQAMLGEAQLKWLKNSLMASKATWKVIASDMPLGLIIPDGKDYEGVAGGGGPPQGREVEIAELLSFAKAQGVKGMVWLTADVHYAAAHHYHPDRARFRDFDPFWEFVAGPLHAGGFGPNTLDDTFGPKLEFLSLPEGLAQNTPPSAGHQFYGTVEVEPTDRTLTVRLHRSSGELIYTQVLSPAG